VIRRADRTFSPERIEAMKAYYVANATGPNPTDCLITLNAGLKILYDNPNLKLGDSVDRTMAALRNARPMRADNFRTRNFLTERADGSFRSNRGGVLQPDKLDRSVWDYVIGTAAGTPGYTVFGCSPMDGYHSVLLILDNRDADAPKVYWADQWSTKGGWKLYSSKEELDGEITRLTHNWWLGKFNSTGQRFKTRCRLYQLIPDAANDPGYNLATVIGTPHRDTAPLPLREGPRMTYPVKTDAAGEPVLAYLGDQFAVLERVGDKNQFVRLILPDGTTGWVPSWYLSFEASDDPAVSGLIDQLNSQPKTYTVVGGDSLSKIAKRFDTTVNALKALNGLTSDLILVDQVLHLPQA
jgi:hypothetical protein